MKRIWLPLATMLSLAAIVFFLTPDREEPLPRDVDGPNEVVEKVREAPIQVERTEFILEDIEREPRYGNPVEEGILVTVVDGMSGDRLLGAEVLVLDPEMDDDDELEMELEFAAGIEFREIFSRYGVVYVTDSQAQVRIPKQKVEVLLAGRTAKLFNVVTVPYADSITLRLDPPNLISVQVIDDVGTPVENAPVAIRVRSNYGAASFIRASTDEYGMANLESVDLIRMLDSRDEFLVLAMGEVNFFVALEVLTPAPVESWISLDRLPTKPITLVMPKCGKVGVEVLDAQGVRIKESYFIGLSIFDASATEQSELNPLLQQPVGENLVKVTSKGAAVFPRVAFHQQLQVTVRSKDEKYLAQLVGPGPVPGGGIVVFRLSPQGPWPSFTGRILNTEGLAAANVEFNTELRTQGQGRSEAKRGTLVTDDQGRFRMVLENQPLSNGTTTTWTIAIPSTQKKPHRAVEVDLSSYLEGREYDLGDLVVEALPFLAKGRVVDWNGTPVKNVRIYVESIDPDRKLIGNEIWKREYDLNTTTDADGYFTLTGKLHESRQRIVATTYSHLPAKLEFEPGATDLEFILENSWRVQGKFLCDEHIDPTTLEVVLLNVGQELSSAEFTQFERLESNGIFSFPDQSAGPKTLLLRSSATVLYSAEFTLGPEGGRRVLKPMDLSGQLHTITLHVRDDDGDYLWGAWAASMDETSLGWAAAKPLVIISKSPSLDIKVGANNHGFLVLKGVRGERDVVVPAGYRVKVVIDNAPSLRMGVNLWVHLAPVPKEGEAKPNVNHSENFFLGAPFPDGVTVSLPGTYQVDVTIIDVTNDSEYNMGTEVRIGDGTNLPTIEVRDQSSPQIVHVSLNQKDLDDAMERMTKRMR